MIKNNENELEVLERQNKQLRATLHYLHRDAFIARACFSKAMEMCLVIEQGESQETLSRVSESFRSSLSKCSQYLDEIDNGNEEMRKYFDVSGENAVFIRDYL